MQLLPWQNQLLIALRSAVSHKPDRRVTYKSKWLGYLPFGLYHWVEIDGTNVSNTFPIDWSLSDLQYLAKAGCLVQISEWQNPADEYETEIVFQVT